MSTATEAWLNSLDDVFSKGNTTFPRQNETKELLNEPIHFDMNYLISGFQ